MTVGSATVERPDSKESSAALAEEEKQASLFRRLYPALTVPAYRLLWGGMLPAQGAQAMSQVAVGYAAFTLTGSATMLGLVSFAGGLPGVFLTLAGGVVADRFPRRKVLMGTQITMLVSALIMTAIIATGSLQFWHLIVLGVVQNASFAFNGPSRQALMGEVVGPKLVRNAVALNMTGMSTARILGPSLAGAILSVPLYGLVSVFGVMSAMYVFVLGALMRMARYTKGPETIAQDGRPRQNAWEQLKEGLAYIAASPALRILMLMGLVPVLLAMPLQQLMPVFSERVFESGPAGLGAMSASMGVGALLGSLTAAPLSSTGRPVLVQLVVGSVLGLALTAFALAPFFWLACLMLVLVGFGQACYSSLNSAQIVMSAEPRLHGRVMSVNMMMFFVVPVISLPLAWACDVIGAHITVAMCGAAILVCMLAVAKFNPGVWKAATD